MDEGVECCRVRDDGGLSHLLGAILCLHREAFGLHIYMLTMGAPVRHLLHIHTSADENNVFFGLYCCTYVNHSRTLFLFKQVY